jgi:hypothetical protein
MRLGSSCRYYADPVIPQGVSDEQETIVHHRDEGVAILAMVLAVVLTFDAERVFERVPGGLEADAVLGIVVGRLLLIPTRIRRRSYRILLTSSYVNERSAWMDSKSAIG